MNIGYYNEIQLTLTIKMQKKTLQLLTACRLPVACLSVVRDVGAPYSQS